MPSKSIKKPLFAVRKSGDLFESHWSKWFLVAGIWLLPVAFSTMQIYWRFSVTGRSVILPEILFSQVALWSVWAILSLLIIQLGRQFPFQRDRWISPLIVHLFASIFIALVYIAFYASFVGYVRETLNWSWLSGNYMDFLSLRFSFDFAVYWLVLGIYYAISYFYGNRPPEASAIQNSGYRERLAIKSNGHIRFVKVEHIDWIEAADQYVKIHAGSKTHLLRESMNEIQKKLSPKNFLRIHRSTIVNIERITELQPYQKGDYIVLLDTGESLKLSRNYRKQLQSLFP